MPLVEHAHCNSSNTRPWWQMDGSLREPVKMISKVGTVSAVAENGPAPFRDSDLRLIPIPPNTLVETGISLA